MYCTLADLQAQIPEATLIQLTNETLPLDATPVVNSAVVEATIRYAEDLMDAHLRGRYSLPLKEMPTVLRDIAITLVRYRLYARRPEGALPESIKEDHKTALRQLEAIRDAKLTLGLQTTGTDLPESGEIRVQARTPVFGGRDGLLESY